MTCKKTNKLCGLCERYSFSFFSRPLPGVARDRRDRREKLDTRLGSSVQQPSPAARIPNPAPISRMSRSGLVSGPITA